MKTDPRVEAYGSSDEAVSALGLSRALSCDEWIKGEIMQLQRDLFVVGAELATDRESYALLQKHFSTVTPGMTDRLETIIDKITSEIELPRSFIIPGASAASAAMDLARTAVRRTERAVVALQQAGELENPEILRYLNRLSDLLFMIARYEDRALPFEALTGDAGTAGRQA